jgi:hypothetical protein
MRWPAGLWRTGQWPGLQVPGGNNEAAWRQQNRDTEMKTKHQAASQRFLVGDSRKLSAENKAPNHSSDLIG